MKKLNTKFLILLLTFTATITAQDVSFLNHSGYNSIGTQENRTASITLFDIDMDGDLDVLIANGRH